ncbi:hypothetical protein E4U30_007982 [Claviceps sp. LM220 group G6]|nr:hypothetical protein E4U15_002047 [Claviceps sp. LM218 group G6]KAG6098443.1 hypothetical protein E4U30_007982 [Claviceps sp. LM220 group G6]KAG6110642.1 hypothetical protein E4U31_005483 [Claviceps sp. LM219 group G6]
MNESQREARVVGVLLRPDEPGALHAKDGMAQHPLGRAAAAPPPGVLRRHRGFAEDGITEYGKGGSV